MEATEAVDTDKKMQRNAAQRIKYAQMSQQEKDIMLQKRRERYANKKLMLIAEKNKTPTPVSQEGKYEDKTKNDDDDTIDLIIDNHIAATEKRLQRNAAQRRRYAQISQSEKDIILQKRRQRYNNKKLISIEIDVGSKQTATSKRPEARSGHICNMDVDIFQGLVSNNSAEHSFSKKADTRQMRKIEYADKNKQSSEGSRINLANKDQRDKGILLKNASDKGKAQINYSRSSDLANSDQQDRGPLLKKASDKGKAPMISHNSFDLDTEVQEQPRIANEVAEITEEAIPKISRKRSRLHQVLATAKKRQRDVSCREYYCYKLQIRPGEKSILLRAGRLLQQYVVDMYVKVETSRLDYFRNNQADIRGEVYQGIMDSIASGETRASKVVADDDDQMVDEIERFQSARWISPAEAMWRIYRFALNEMRPAVQSLHLHLEGKSGAFFIDGPGGTGKTFLYCALLATVRSKGHIALATATSGVAASILPGGRTAHSRFKIPIDINESGTCNISKQTGLAKLIRAAKLIIWDEAAMARRQVIEAFSDMLQDINDCTIPFGGKVVVFGGDFRQILPVIPKSTKEESINASLITSKLWPALEKVRLTENMRAKFDPSFTDFLLRIGNGVEPCTFGDKISIPQNMLIPFSDSSESMKLLARHVFPELQEYAENPRLMTYRAILTPTNDNVDEINNLLIESFPGGITRYKSFDRTLDATQQSQHEDFLNTLAPQGLPPHILELKPNCPVILLRNIDPPEGLSNGTRLICRTFTRNLIYAEIAVGSHQGKKVFLPRIPLQPSDNRDYPIPFARSQFPIRVCFAMTINKAQGQTLENVGIYLPQPVFSHGQLYVALSRARTSGTVKVMIKPTLEDQSDYNCTKNVVYQEVLLLAGN